MALLISSKVTPSAAAFSRSTTSSHLRRGRQAFDINVLKHRALRGGGEQLVFRAHQFGIAALAAILQAEAEAAGIAEIVDRRRLQRGDFAVAQRREGAVDVGDDLLRRSRTCGRSDQSFSVMNACAVFWPWPRKL